MDPRAPCAHDSGARCAHDSGARCALDPRDRCSALAFRAARCDRRAYGRWCQALLERGVYPPASQFEAWFPSLAHTAADVERTLEAAAEAFVEIAGTR